VVEGCVDAVEVEAGDAFFDGVLHGVIEEEKDGREGEVGLRAAAGEVDGFAGGVDEAAGVDGGFIR